MALHTVQMAPFNAPLNWLAWGLPRTHAFWVVDGWNCSVSVVRKSFHLGSRVQNSWHRYYANTLQSTVTIAAWSFSVSDTSIPKYFSMLLFNHNRLHLKIWESQACSIYPSMNQTLKLTFIAGVTPTSAVNVMTSSLQFLLEAL